MLGCLAFQAFLSLDMRSSRSSPTLDLCLQGPWTIRPCKPVQVGDVQQEGMLWISGVRLLYKSSQDMNT